LALKCGFRSHGVRIEDAHELLIAFPNRQQWTAIASNDRVDREFIRPTTALCEPDFQGSGLAHTLKESKFIALADDLPNVFLEWPVAGAMRPKRNLIQVQGFPQSGFVQRIVRNADGDKQRCSASQLAGSGCL